MQLMGLDPESDDHFEKVLSIIQAEPSFSIRVLAAANSAATGSTAPARTLRTALARVGSRVAASMLLAVAVTRIFVPRDPWEKSLWRHAIQVALASRQLAAKAAHTELLPDEAYTCGLLHDIGRFVMFQRAPDTLRAIDEGGWTDPQALVKEELRICGLSHAELGASACAQWGLPDSIVRVVRNHHSLSTSKPAESSVDQLTRIVQVADFVMFPSARPGVEGLESQLDEVLEEVCATRLPHFLPLDADDLRVVLLAVKREADETAGLLAIG